MTGNGAGWAPGRIGWLELNAQRVTRAAAFYGALFAWQMRPMHVAPFGTLPLIADGETAFANQFMAMGAFAPPRWLAWLAGDIDRAAARIAALGAGKAELSEIPGNGRRLDARDPGGTQFGMISPEFEPWPAGRPGLPHAAELWAPDGAERAGFYADVLGLEARRTGWGAVLSDGAAPRLFLRSTRFEISPPRWIPYFRVASTGADTERARRLGAIIQVPDTHWPGMGRLAVLTEPGGTSFGLLEPEAVPETDGEAED
ncbi:VOC family protein [Paralimibaculum aggregatum]|uniref:VOC family protein n=1 Tax=Paralimibaculum aggregatum TaxID=3036245 RepID=A0ABQ6LP70_9RHOB|nr:VOC family protein [Limibaculum sp. NKW23]GMG82075.1 VOC family protein [Limibaculum sp. NKW23]